MDPNTTPRPFFSPMRYQLFSLGQVPPVHLMPMPNNNTPLQYRLSHFTAVRPCNIVFQQVPLNISTAPKAPNDQIKHACENSAVANTQSQPSDEPTFVIGPAFSLADHRETGHDLTPKDVSKAGSSDGGGVSYADSCIVDLDKCEIKKSNATVPTIQSSKELEPSIEPQICIGSVFSLADGHTQDTDQHSTDRNINPLATESSMSQKATEQACQAQPPSTDQGNQKNTVSRDVRNLPKICSEPVSNSSLPSTLHNPAMISNKSRIYNKCIASQSSSNICTNRIDILSGSTDTQIENIISPKQCSGSEAVSTPTNSCAARAISAGPVQIITSTVDTATSTLLGSSLEQQDANKIISEPGIGYSETSKMDSVCDKFISNQDSRILPPAVKTKEPEVVDLDTEDVEDCLLVKIDLSKHFIPYGLQIHNTEVVIHDSDTDDDIAEQTPEAEDQNLPAKSVSSSDSSSLPGRVVGDKDQNLPAKSVSSSDSSSLSGRFVGDKDKSLQRTVCSTVVVNENNSCNLIGSLDMEVEEINIEVDEINTEADEINTDVDEINMEVDEKNCETDTEIRETDTVICETDTVIRSILRSPPFPYTYSTEGNMITPLALQESVTLSSRCSVLSSKKDNHVVPDEANSEKNNVTSPHLFTDPQNLSSFDRSESEFELMELHVDDETPLSSTQNENIKLKVITPSKCSPPNIKPSKCSPPNINLPYQMPESTKCSSLTTPISSTIIITKTESPVIQADDQNVFSAQTSEAWLHPRESITHISSLHMINENVNTAISHKQNLEVINTSKQAKPPKTSNKCHKKGKIIKSITHPIKQFSLPESHKNANHNEFSLRDGVSATPADIESKSSLLLCKLCYVSFPSRMDLVTHTWNCHRHPMNQSYKCEFCDKNFVSSSLLKLHRKIKCVTLDKQIVETGIAVNADTPLVQNQLTEDNIVETVKKNRDNSTIVETVKKNRDNSTIVETVKKNRDNSTIVETVKENRDNSTIVETVKENRDNSTTFLCDDSISRPKKDCVGQKETDCNQLKKNVDSCLKKNVDSCLKKNVDPCHTEVNFVRSETDLISINKSTNSEPQIKDSHKEHKMTLVEPYKPSTLCSDADIDEETEQEDVEPDTLCSAAVEHQSVSEFNKISKNKYFRCFVCQSAFTESTLRYRHMWNSPGCFEGINKYCSMCCTMFKTPADKQAHLSLSKSCWMNEVKLIKDVANVNPGRVEQSASLIHENIAPQKFQTPLTNEGKSKTVFTTHEDSCETKADVILHLSDKSDCGKNIVYPLLGSRGTSLNGVKSKQRPLQGENRQGKVSQAEIYGNLNAKKIVQCMVCETKFSTHGELVNHYINKQSCLAMCGTNVLPKSTKSRIIVNPVSVICKACHLTFADDFKLAKHLQLSHTCFHSEKTSKDIDKKLSSVNKTVKKGVKKIHSCEIVSGISSSTRTVTLMSANEGNMSVLEQPIEQGVCRESDLNGVNTYAATLPSSNIGVLNCVNDDHLSLTMQQSELDVNIKERLNDANKNAPILLNSDMTVLDNSKTIQVCAVDKECRDGNENLSDLSSSDFESEIGAESSASEESSIEYKCKLCRKTFIHQSLLIKHTKLDHSSQVRTIHCKVCTRKFLDLTGLQAHMLQFRYCFIPLTRKLWERKQDPQFCNICRKSVRSPKDLRKHCFKNMACRLRYIKMMLKSIKKKNSSQISVLPSSKSSKTDLQPSEIANFVESNQGSSGVSSSVLDCEKPHQSDNHSTFQPNVGDFHNATNIAACNNKPVSQKECLNCGKAVSDFTGHLFKQQACLDFYGNCSNKSPVPIPFCFQCKQCFDNILMLTKHTCRGFVAYSHTCTACGLKFTSESDFKRHTELCNNAVSLYTPAIRNHQNENSTVVINPHKIHQESEHFPAPKVKLVTSTCNSECSAEQSFPCLICDAKFPLLRLLMQHSYQHMEEIPLKCDRCDTMFVHYNQFVSHQTFHIRMDKEKGVLPVQIHSKDLPPVLEKFGSFMDSLKDQENQKVSHSSSVCLFCHQDFPNKAAKVDHISNAPACLGIMKYIIENKFYSKGPEDNQSYKITTDPNHCEFCQHNFLDKISHYLQSACIEMLEKAILRFRASPSGPIVSKSQSKETTSITSIFTSTTTTSPFIKAHNFHCPICKQRFEDQILLSGHQREEHGQSSVLKSPTGSIMDMVNEPDYLYCLTCTKCLRTIIEVENHNSLCKKPSMVLPISAAVQADWAPQHLKCKICNFKYSLKSFLIKHMISRHCDETNVLLGAAGLRTLPCTICGKNILLLKLHSHFQQHKKAYLAAIKATLGNDNVICIFCNLPLSRGNVHKHFKKHSLSSIIDSHNHDGTKVALKKKYTKDTHKEVKQKKQRLGTALPNTDSIFSSVRCRLCHKILPNLGSFKFHFKNSHKQHDPKNWKIRFNLIEPLKPKHDLVETSTSEGLSSLKSVCVKKNTSFYTKSPSNSIAAEKSYDHDEFGIDGHNKKTPPFTHKIAKFQPVGSCKICHKQFRNFSMFRFHLKTLHNRYDPQDLKTFFQPIAPLGTKNGFGISSGSSLAESPERQFTSFYRMLDTDVNSEDQFHNELALSGSSALHTTAATTDSPKSLFRVCLLCQTNFSNASLYQTHLKTHIIPCNIILQDHFNQKAVNGESEHVEDVEIIQNIRDVNLKLENDF